MIGLLWLLAQAPPGAATNAQPPEAVGEVVAEYPAQALRDRLEGTVVLRVSVDAEGTVTDAEVVESAGHGFDEAARAAALRVRYRPARQGEVNVASRVLQRVEFRLPPETPEDTAPPQAPAEPEKPALPAVEAPFDVTVRGPSDAERLRQSAEAVTVVEAERASRETADLGEVLARTQGVGVRRSGGLGSSTRFSLNGLTDGQVRFFLDGIPLELAGYPFGIANVPVNGLERVEVYSGVVPIRFGADALGGGVNLVTDQDLRGQHAGAAYEVGSFDTHRVTVGGRHLHEPTGLFTRLNGFFDYARNDYPVDVEVPDERGRLSPATVHRFHDGYRAYGANAELGLVDRPWARRLLLRGYVTEYDKEYQHNASMKVPYGGVTYGERAVGLSLRYEQDLGRRVSVDAVAGFARVKGKFSDVASCVYDWFGRCVRQRNEPGETDDRPLHQLYWDHSAFGRANLSFQLHPQHTLRLALAPTYLSRSGNELRQSNPTGRDPLSAERKLTTVVNGVEYEFDFFDERLENIAFVKQYLQLLNSEEPRPGGTFRRRDRDTHDFGFGDALRFKLTAWLIAKASYEFATRLPRPEEIFGDNAFVVANLELEPEISHNANLGLHASLPESRLGRLRTGANAFLRDAENLIVLLGTDRVQSYQNVFGARSLGVEATLGWTSPGEFVELDGNVTYQDFRNVSSQGTFGDFAGDRIPNRPYLFANGHVRVQFRDVVRTGDEVSLTWVSRYVHEYFRSWESIGLREFKQVIDAQLVHGMGFGYLVRNGSRALSSTLEVQNLTDEAVFDFYGVERPGRAYFAKMTGEF